MRKWTRSDFNPRSLTGATMLYVENLGDHLISIHAPLRERLQVLRPTYGRFQISIHAPLRERRGVIFASSNTALFQSTLPCGSDSKFYAQHTGDFRFQSTLPCGSDGEHYLFVGMTVISIHAPLRERLLVSVFVIAFSLISIHAPLRERPASIPPLTSMQIFQSTLPCGSDCTGS